MITAISADGTDVRAFDDGQGPVILIIHPGLDDGRSWQKVATRLAGRFRVVRIVRRHYRVDIPAAPCYSMATEVEDVLALAKLLGEPIVIVGHSSASARPRCRTRQAGGTRRDPDLLAWIPVILFQPIC